MDRSGTVSGDSETPEQKLQAVVGHLSHAVESSACAGSKYEPLGRVLVFRPAAQSLHVVGDSPLAAEFRRLVTAGAVPGWGLHPVPAGRTPLHVLAGSLHRLSGSNWFYNLLEREGFAFVEEVAVTPEGCLLEFRNSGPRFIASVRQVIADLGFGDADAGTGRLLAPGHDGPAAAGPVPPAALPADAAGALQVVAAWAVAERGAQKLEDLLTLAPGVGDLPPDVARSWDRIRRLSLRLLAGAALADDDLPRLALVIAEIDYMVLDKVGAARELDVIDDLTSGAYEIPDLDVDDLRAARRLVGRHQDLKIGLTDAVNAVLAERYDSNEILTTDQRHFRVIAPLTRRFDAFRILPADF